MSSKNELKIDWATHEAAKFACENWHYSKSVPVPPVVKIAAYELGKFIGVILFSRGASSNLLKPYGLSAYEGCELTRVALSMHKSPVTRILSVALKFLKKNSPNLRLIVSFADPNRGHHGGIYQGGGWIYSGKSDSSYKFVDNKGREWHSRQVSEKGFNIQSGSIRKTVKPSQCIKVFQEGKHRYLMPLDKEMKIQIEKLRKPYPKRASSVESGTSVFQTERGGESPTDALQEKNQ